HVEHAFLAFLGEQRLQCFPHGARARGRALEKFAVPFVRRVVALNEVANVDAALPRARLESPPCGSRKLAYLFWIGCHGVRLRSRCSGGQAIQRFSLNALRRRYLGVILGPAEGIQTCSEARSP